MRNSKIFVDLTRIVENLGTIRQALGNSSSQPMVVVKANAYGHGLVRVSRHLQAHGVDWLAVSSLPEALKLRSSGVSIRILCLTPICNGLLEEAIRKEVRLSVFDRESLSRVCKAAQRAGIRAIVHLKINTGMNRFGVDSKAVTLLHELFSAQSLIVEGVYTHFATADDSDDGFLNEQLCRFNNFVNVLSKADKLPCVIHAENSAATLKSLPTHFNVARVGLAAYGYSPFFTQEVQGLLTHSTSLKPALSWTATVAQIHSLAMGESVGYSRTFIAARQSRIAIVPVGYADGIPRRIPSWPYVLIHGIRAPLVGNVSMDSMAVDITDFNLAVKPGDEAVLIGSQGSDQIDASEIAAYQQTIPYETLVRLNPLIPRVYTQPHRTEDKQSTSSS